jgi:DNA-directed RNA polymerase subunit omega
MLPSPDILNEFQPGKFVLSNLAAKRAKQLREGAPPLVQIDSNHPLTIALAEIAAGKIKAIMPSAQDQAVIEGPESALLIDETVPAELGMLLPALDETEAALVTSTAIAGEEEHEAELEPDEAEPISLSDLVEDEEEEAPIAPADDDTLSLSDIAEQETAEEEEAEE